MPIYSPTGFLDITNATLRTSNLEAQNFKLNGGNIYVTSELTTDELLNLDNVVNAGNATSNTVQFTNLTTGLVADSNIVVTGNVTAGSFLGDGSGLTSIPPSAITGTLSQWSDGTNSDVYIASNVGIGNVHTLTSNTLQVGANLYVRDADANVLTVTGNVAADYFEGDGSKLTGISSTLQAITDSGNVTSNTVQFSNATTGFVTTSNIEVGGALKINTITAAAYHSLQAVTNVGNVTSNTVQFSNATTGLVTTGNVEVGRDLSVTGNLTVLGTRTIVDTDTLRVKDPIIELGKDNPGTGDLGLVMTRPSGSSNVGIIFDESESTLEIGYTQSNASDTDITMRTAATEPLDVNVNGNVSVGKELTVSGNVAVDTDTLFVDSVNDRVGVGTTSPGDKLHLYGATDSTLRVETDTGQAQLLLRSGASTRRACRIDFSRADTGTQYMQLIGDYQQNGTDDLTVATSTSGRIMTWLQNGNVGIGAVDPKSVLHVSGDAPKLAIADNTEDDCDVNGFSTGIAFVDNTWNGTTLYAQNPAAGMGFYLGHLSGASKEVNMKNLTGELSFGTRNVHQAMYIDNDGSVGIGTTSPSAPLDVPGGIASPGFQAQYGLTCAGLVTWTGTHLSWVHRIIAIPVEKNEFGASGFLDMYVPTSGTSITYYGGSSGSTTKTTTADGFPIGEWEALWYVVTPGQTTSTVNSQYVITGYQNASWKPNSNWLLLAVRSGDTSQQPYLKFIPTNGNYYTWIAPTFGTNWGNYGGSYNTAGYYRDGDGIVHLRGLVTGGSYSSGATLFTLPAGFRPGGRHLFSIISNQAHGRLDITSAGQVIPYVGASWISLDGISFKAEQ